MRVTIHVRPITPAHFLWESEKQDIAQSGPRIAVEAFYADGSLCTAGTFCAATGWSWAIDCLFSEAVRAEA